jgi:hypothetical protein
MEGPGPGPSAQDGKGPSIGSRDWPWLLGALVLAIVLRAWSITHTVVIAQDSVEFIRLALELDSPPSTWPEVLSAHHKQPAYSLTIMPISRPMRAIMGETPEALQISAQLASALAGVLLVIPMFYLGKMLVDRKLGFCAAILFQCLPESCNMLGDGLCEPLFLLFTSSALLAGMRAMATYSVRLFVVCGLFIGLSYLTRPEGGLVLVAMIGVLLGSQYVKTQRRPWRQVGVCGLGLLLAAAVVGCPYVAATRRFSTKPSVKMIFEGPFSELKSGTNRGGSQPAIRSGGASTSLWAAFINTDGPWTTRLGRSATTLLSELVRGFHYVWALPVVIGWWWFRDLIRKMPGLRMVMLLCGLDVGVLLALGTRAGYISERHVMLLVLLGTYPAVSCVREVPRRLWPWTTALVRRDQQRLARHALALFVVLLGLGLPKALQPLHAKQRGFHEAGRWLATHWHPGDSIRDDHHWAYFYAGGLFRESQPMVTSNTATEYVVVGKSADLNEPRKVRMPVPDGKIVFHWPPYKPLERASVLIYALPSGKTVH